MLATNTSTLDIDAIASATSRPEPVVGLHFFSPANVMRLLEIVRGQSTSAQTLRDVARAGQEARQGRRGRRERPGFVGNRMMFPYMYETQFLVEEGATPEQVDAALTGLGMAMGMFAVDDMAGIDVAIRAQQALGHFTGPANGVRWSSACWSSWAGSARRPARAGIATATTGNRNPIRRSSI